MSDRASPRDAAESGGAPLRFGVRSIGMALAAARLEQFLEGRYCFVFLPPGVPPSGKIDGLAGWGRKGRVGAEAAGRELPYLALEDGFLRTAGLGGRRDPPLSLTADLTGVHYDARAPSDIEDLIRANRPMTVSEGEAVLRLIELMRAGNLGKFNAAPDVAEDHPIFAAGPPVVVVDQIAGDKSIAGGLCDAETFELMLEAAVRENPGRTVVARVHPYEGRGGRKGHLRAIAAAHGARLFDADVSWMSVARRAARVYVATSQAGLEALIAGAPVTCFGLPAYAGWGLTDDRQSCPRRGLTRTLEQVICALYLRYSRYLSPLDGQPCPATEVARLLALHRRRDAENRGLTHVVGLNRLKRHYARPFLEGPGARASFGMSFADALLRQKTEGGRLLIWSSREPDGAAAASAAQGAALVRMEDGFLRSVGLGANMQAPASLVFDRTGIYYDPSAPSDLECLLQDGAFSEDVLDQASALRRLIVDNRLSKYNVGAEDLAFPRPAGRLVLLVPGQVEDDASVQRGGGSITSNLGLLQAVRAARPDAFLVYKPHPDVEAGLRPGALTPSQLDGLADATAHKASAPALLARVDEVHTLTSLLGFEALMRDLAVSTYGMPFYAGWGLTHDYRSNPRRTRRLTLDQLVAGSLILYPRYVHRASGWPCEAADVVHDLVRNRHRASGSDLIVNRRLRTLAARLQVWRRGRS